MDIETVARAELDRIYPPPRREPDWSAVLAAAGTTRRWFTWRWKLALAGLVVAVALGAAVLPGTLLERGKVDVVDRALAAVSQGPVLHAVLEIPAADVTSGPDATHATIVDLASGDGRLAMVRFELWYDGERQMLHMERGGEGAVFFNTLVTPGARRDNRRGARPTEGPARIDPGLAAFVTGYREALEKGEAAISGRATLDGRPVTWLRFPPDHRGGAPEEVAVDSQSYEAAALRPVCPSECEAEPPIYRIRVLAGVSHEDADFTPPPPPEPHAAAVGAQHRTITLAEAATALERDVVWPGPEIEGLPLAGVQLAAPWRYSALPLTEANLMGRGRGLQYFYGGTIVGKHYVPPSDGPSVAVTVSADWEYVFAGFNFNNGEFGQPMTEAGTGVPREGEAAVTSLQQGYWTAQLRRDGLYVEIHGPSRQLVVAAARSLRPLAP
jgi:hypothetical protein